MKHNWEYRPFDRVAHTITPISKIEKSEYLTCGLVPIISQEETVVSGYWNNFNDITPHQKSVVIFGDHSRVLKYIDFEFVVGADGVKIIEPKEDINTKFLYYYLHWLNIPSLGYSRHFKLVKEALYAVPPMEVQEQIVAELDKINELIEQNRELLRHLDSLAQSLFYDTFGDPITNPKGFKCHKLSEIVTEKLSYGSGASGLPFDGRLRYIRITDIDENGNLKDEIASSPSAFDSKYLLHDGDILFARSGATVGKTYLYRNNVGMAIYAGYLIRARLNQNFAIPIFLYYFTKSKFYWDYIHKSIRGAAQPNVNAQLYGLLHVICPPLALQNQFAAQIKAIEAQKATVEKSIAELQTMLDSRMDYWFN